MKVLFFGSDEFALESLQALLESDHVVVAVIGRPDRPSGRGLKEACTPVVGLAREKGIALYQPENLSAEAFGGTAASLDWDSGVVVAYGSLIPGWLLETPGHGFINLHPSLLPRYRGAAPVERALMNGASITGVTTILMNERLDAGDLLMHREVPMTDDDTAATLRERLSHLGAKLLIDTLEEIDRGEMEPVPQEEDKATYAPPISKEEGDIDWTQPAERIDRLIRALNPDPGAFTFFRGRRVKLWSALVTDVPPEGEPGTIENMGREGFIVNTGSTGIEPLLLQPEGRQKMGAAEFSRGQRIETGESFTRQP